MIEFGINNNEPFKRIAKQIEKFPTTISKEIRTHSVFENIPLLDFTESSDVPWNKSINDID